jgi:predicted homoserine dehydrogenase-like protein
MAKTEAVSSRAMPCGLLDGGTVIKPIAKGELITHDNARVADGSKIAALRAKQNAMVAAL